MDVSIRKAEPGDVPRMLELVRELAIFEQAPNEVTVSLEEMHDAGFGTNAVWVGWVAETSTNDGARTVGMAICYERYSTWKGRRLYLEDIVVTEQARSQRIGEKLFKQCAAYAVEKNYRGMLWQVLDWNTEAIRFYDRFGAKMDPAWYNGSLELDQLKKITAQ